MGDLVRAYDWAATPLGPIDTWPAILRASVSLCLHSAFPTLVYWGDDYRTIYNDAFIELFGRRHPRLGWPGEEAWPELWPTLIPIFQRIRATGEGASMTDRNMTIIRGGERVESWWNSSFTPIIDDDGTVRGILSQPREITGFVLQRRHDQLMLALDERLGAAGAPAEQIDAALALIGEALGVQRTGFGEIEGGMLHIRRCWTDETMPDVRGSYPLGTFGRRVSALCAAGKSIRLDDIDTDPTVADEPDTLAAYRRIGLRSGLLVPIVDGGGYRGGLFVQQSEPRHWTAHEIALAEAAARRLWQALLRARAEIAERDLAERYRLIFEQADDIIFATDLDQVVIDCNPATERAVGLPRDRIVGRSIADFVSPEQLKLSTERLAHRLATGETTRNEIEVFAADGRALRWEVASSLFKNRDGAPIGLHTVARDVTARRAFDERRELLIGELNHRVKNTLSLVQALARQSFAEGAERAAFTARLAALAGAHDLLTRDQWEGATLADLARAATRPVEADERRIAIAGASVTVPPKAAVALVMAFHELATNARKYGALSAPEGRVEIALDRLGRDGFRLDWRESGGPPVAEPARHGFGLRMIERALASDLGGRVTIGFAPAGLTCSIEAPGSAA